MSDLPLAVLGLDPGKTGALGILGLNGDYLGAYKLEDPSPQDLVQIFSQIDEMVIIKLAALEDVHGVPGWSVQSTSHLMRSKGMMEALVAAYAFPLVYVTSQKWRTLAHSLKGPHKSDKERKEKSLIFAQARWPSANLTKTIHIDIADSLCIAEYARITWAVETDQDQRLNAARESFQQSVLTKEALLEKARGDYEAKKKEKEDKLEKAREELARIADEKQKAGG